MSRSHTKQARKAKRRPIQKAMKKQGVSTREGLRAAAPRKRKGE